ncbi:MAG: arginine repressor [Bacillota bacterium]
MKNFRQTLIIEAVKSGLVGTQEELGVFLAQNGLKVTQATISRDIKELGLIKVSTSDGRYCYVLPSQRTTGDLVKKARRIFEDSVSSFDYSENLVVVKTAPGLAHGVAAAVDNLNWPGIIGTIAGDDTILIVVKEKAKVRQVLDKLQELRG